MVETAIALWRLLGLQFDGAWEALEVKVLAMAMEKLETLQQIGRAHV